MAKVIIAIALMLKEQYIGLVEICKSWQSWPQICSMNKAEELKAKHMNPC